MDSSEADERPIPALDGLAVDDFDDSAVVTVRLHDDRGMVGIDAWDDGLGLDVSLLLTLPNARTLLERLGRAIRTLEERGA